MAEKLQNTINNEHTLLKPNQDFMREVLYPRISQIVFALFVGLVINSMLLVLPFFIRHVYNDAIPSESKTTLIYLGIGVLLALILTAAMRYTRSFFMSRVGNSIGYEGEKEVITKTLSLTYAQFIRSTVPTHISRYLGIKRIGEFFSTPPGINLTDIPFVFIFIIAVFFLGGALALVPLISILFYVVTILVFNDMRSRLAQKAGTVSSEKREMEHLLATKAEIIAMSGESEQWLGRYQEVSANSATYNLRSALVNSAYQSVTHAISLFTALATLSMGIYLVLDGTLSPGGLIASMMLIWRVTGPLQAAASTATGLKQVKSSVNQLHAMARIPNEANDPSLVSDIDIKRWSIIFERVLFRYLPERMPALSGVSFKLEEGKILAVTGPNGSGKTTLLETIAGIFHPQSGAVLFDEKDIRQFNPVELRSKIGFVPEKPSLFPGTVKENLTIVNAEKDVEELTKHLLETIGESVDINELAHESLLPQPEIKTSFEKEQALILARALVNNPKLVIMDNPAISEVGKFRETIIEFINKSRGKRTIVFSSHDPELLKLADLVLIMNDGEVAHFGELKKEEKTE
jgi:ABC-type bacteriocin/lantibiotic exporter with double-glycine peptidase domain